MSRKNRFIFIFGYVGFLAFLFEGSARLAFSIPQIGKRLEANEEYTYIRNWVREHQKSGTATYYSFDMYDPYKGWIPKPNLRDVNAYNDKILNTNSKGLRGKKDFPYAKNRERLRILILGDSFTFGDEVSDNETYSHYLQEMLPDTEVINMGVHGYGHDQMLMLFKEEGVKYQPDIVILGFLPLDMSRNLLDFRDFAKPRFVLEKGELKLTGTPVPRPEEILRWDWTRPRLLDLFSLIRHSVKKASGLQQREMEAITTAILMELIRSVESIHATPILAYLPRGREIALDVAVTQDEKYMFSVCQLNEQPSASLRGHTLPRKLLKEKPSNREGTGNLRVIVRSPRQLNVIWLMKVMLACRNCLVAAPGLSSCCLCSSDQHRGDQQKPFYQAVPLCLASHLELPP